jgi:hypothetical protein
MYNLVNVVGRDARLCLTRRDVQHFSSQSAHLAHAFLLLLGQDGDLVPVDKHLL